MALRRSKPKTFTDRVKAGGSIAGEAVKAAGTAGTEVARTVRDRADRVRKDAPGVLESGRKRALAAAGAAAGAAGAFAFWRSRRDDRPPTHTDPAAGTDGAKPEATPKAAEPPTTASKPTAPKTPAKTGAAGDGAAEAPSAKS